MIGVQHALCNAHKLRELQALPCSVTQATLSGIAPQPKCLL